MAEIDKALPNVRHEIKVPGAQAPTDVDITEEQPRQPVDCLLYTSPSPRDS